MIFILSSGRNAFNKLSGYMDAAAEIKGTEKKNE